MEGPKAMGIETSDTRQSVETASVGIAGKVMELFELAEDGKFGGGTERALQIGQRGDFVAEQELLQSGSWKSDGAHNDSIATTCAPSLAMYT